MRALVAVALGLSLALTGCTEDTGGPDAREPATSGGTPASPSQDPSPGASGSPALDGGTPGDPVVLTPRPRPLDWIPVEGDVETTVTAGDRWTLSYDDSATEATLRGPEPATVRVPRRHRITDALLDGRYAVVVAEDELAAKPNTATVIDLANGERFTVDGSSDVPTTTGGAWALGDGRLLHATVGPERAYCLATVDLASRRSEVTWCAPARHGFNAVRVTPAGVSLMTFDDQRPSCRTVGSVAEDDVVPLPGVPKCLGWDGALLDGGAIWSVVRHPNRVESAHFFARTGEDHYDLGPGTSGSLLWCGDAAYFVRDPQRDGEPARLMRWTAPASLEVAFETRGRGPAFLTEPRCGGDRITVTALAESGDRQLSAPVRPPG